MTSSEGQLARRYGPFAVVTGASDGIGRAFAIALAEAGLGVVLVARRGAVLTELAAELTRRHGVPAHTVAVDLGEPSGIAAVIQGTASFDVGLFVAAAGFGSSGAFIDASVDEELGMIDVNCRSVAALSHHFGLRFARQRRGGIILMSSIVAFQGVPRAANYAATKAYVQSFAEGLRLELSAFGVDVLAAAPGPVHSGFARRAEMVMGRAELPGVVARRSLASLGKRGTARPGFLSKLLGWSLALLPRALRVYAMAAVMRGMSRRPV